MAIAKAPRRPGAPARTVAIEIGFSQVKAVEIDNSAGDSKLVHRGSAPLSASWWDHPATTRAELTRAIRAAVSSAGITATQVAVAMPRRLVTLKYARLPHAEPEHIRGLVQFEAQQYIPFQLDEVVLDHQVVSDETDEMMTVMIVAARRDLIENIMGAFDDAGLQVTRLSISSLGLAEHARGTVAPVALLEVGPGEMDLAIVADGKLLFSRSAVLASATDSPVDNNALAGEVVRSFAAYQNEYRSVGVSALLVGGPSASTAHVSESLGNLLDVPVSRMNGRLLPAGDPESLGYVTAIGTAIGADGDGLNRINLIPQSRAEKKAAARRRSQALGVTALVVLVILGAVYFVSKALAEQKQELAEAKKWNARLQTWQKGLTKSKSDHDKIAKTYGLVSISMGRDKPSVDILKAVSDCVPKGGAIHLTQFSFDRNGTVALHGMTKSESAATDFVLALQASGEFLDVRLPYMGDAQAEIAPTSTTPNASKPKPGENMSFIISCKAKGVAAPSKALESNAPASNTKQKTIEAPQ